MTLRGRLTVAFLAVVLGPVLLGAFFVGSTVSAVSRGRTADRLDLAATAVRTSVSALCQQLRASAEAIAVQPDTPARADAAKRALDRDLGTDVTLLGPGDRTLFTTSGGAPDSAGSDWVACDRTGAPAGYRSIAARVELRDDGGAVLGAVIVARRLDEALVRRLAATSGVAVTLFTPAPAGGTGAGGAAGGADSAVLRSTEAARQRTAVARAAQDLPLGRTAEVPDAARYAQRVGPAPDQPLPVVLSAPRQDAGRLYAVLVGAVVLTALLALAAAWWLARSTTRPLAELGWAADRVADGDLAARVPVRAADEVGRLAATFNRMTREMQAYVEALTASRDQLRGHLAVLGDTLSSTHDLDRILQVILQTALAATGAAAGVVVLLDPADGVLIGRTAEGLRGRLPGRQGRPAGRHARRGEQDGWDDEPLRVPVGEGLLGRVAVTGVPLHGRIGRYGPLPSPNEPRCRTYVAVPIATPGQPVLPADPVRAAEPPSTSPAASTGVLALYDRLGGDEFDETDLNMLRTFAGQAAVAVENVRVHREAQRLSLTDPLTGLWNYRYLRESIRREVERASRFGRMLTVLALDLDRFKEVNDTYGHAAGDTVLQEFTRRIRSVIREVDLAFRHGGEEFVLLLPETDAAGGIIVAERVGAVVRDIPVEVEPHHPNVAAPGGRLNVAISVSVGIAVYPDHGTTGQQVLDAADDALYAAKAAGRDTYRLASAGQPPVMEEIQVRTIGKPPADNIPRAGTAIAGSPGGASGGPHPPRQARGR